MKYKFYIAILLLILLVLIPKREGADTDADTTAGGVLQKMDELIKVTDNEHTWATDNNALHSEENTQKNTISGQEQVQSDTTAKNADTSHKIDKQIQITPVVNTNIAASETSINSLTNTGNQLAYDVSVTGQAAQQSINTSNNLDWSLRQGSLAQQEHERIQQELERIQRQAEDARRRAEEANRNRPRGGGGGCSIS